MSRRRVLTREERELWGHVTKTDTPLRLRHAERKPKPELAAEPPLFAAAMKPAGPEPAKPAEPETKPAPAPCRTPKTQAFDPRLGRKLARGHVAFDARLDLHGMRQAEAHASLRGFILRSQLAGYRHVLVITGKGRTAGLRDSESFPAWTPEAGILRRLVPHWLRDEPLAQAVVSFREAAQHHGGSGALYIQLRRPQTLARPFPPR
jgi:DNA-nicking Smr family endonuclease